MSFVVTIDGKDKLTVDSQNFDGGGQGDVYQVTYKNKLYALKWYTAPEIKENVRFKKNLKNNVKAGSPDECFVWPLHFAENEESYGYLMELLDKKRYTKLGSVYTGVKAVKNSMGRVEYADVSLSFPARLNAGMQIAHGFAVLHAKGYAYQDINNGGFFVDTETGDVRIVDCDNVMAANSEDYTVQGTRTFMAPELVSEETMAPTAETDRHSLAVLLFMLYVCAKPFDGKLLAGTFWDDEQEKKFYGKEAVFVWDPDNSSNRPMRGVQDNAINLWPQLPEKMRKAFITAFCDGTKNPSRRPSAKKWLKVLNCLRAGQFVCSCGVDDEIAQPDKNGRFKCPKCGAKYDMMAVGTSSNTDYYPIAPKKEIYSISIGGNSISGVVGKIVFKNGEYGMLNKTENSVWEVTTAKGEVYKIDPKNGFPLQKGLNIKFVAEETNSNGNKTTLEGNGTV